MADEIFTQGNLDGLAAKLEPIDFSDDERVILGTIFRRAAGADVEGFDAQVGAVMTPAQSKAVEEWLVKTADIYKGPLR